MSHSSKLIKPRNGSWEPLIYVSSVRNTGNNLNLGLASEVRDVVVGLSPVGSGVTSEWKVSESRKIVGHTVSENCLLVSRGNLTHWNLYQKILRRLQLHCY